MSLADRILSEAHKKLKRGDLRSKKMDYSEDTYTRSPLLVEKHMGFKKLKASLAHKKHHPSNPAAVAAMIGRKKFGKAKFQAMAAKGRKAACYDESINAVAELKALSEGLVDLRSAVLEGIKK